MAIFKRFMKKSAKNRGFKYISTHLNFTIQDSRDATIYQYIVYLSLHQCIDTEWNRIDISHIVIYQCIMACFNDLLYIMLNLNSTQCFSKKKTHHLFILKATQNNFLSPLCIEQYITVSWYIRGNISIRLHTVSLQLYKTPSCFFFLSQHTLLYTRQIAWHQRIQWA